MSLEGPIAGLLDIFALVPPIVAIFYLNRLRGNGIGLARNNLFRVCIYFLGLVILDSMRDFDQTGSLSWTLYGTIFFLGVIILAFGHMTVVLNYCPDVRTLRESIQRLVKPSIPNLLYHVFNAIGLIWIAGSVLAVSQVGPGPSQYWLDGAYGAPAWYATFTSILMVPLIVYPALLLLFAIGRTKSKSVKYPLVMLLAGWFTLPASQFILLLQTSNIILLPTQLILGLGSVFFIFCALAVRDKSGMIRVLTSQLVPQPMLKTGQRYLVLHDGGKEIVSFLTASLQNLIEAGGRIVLNTAGQGSIMDGLMRGHPRFDSWIRSGKIIGSNDTPSSPSFRESLTERFTPGTTSVTYVTELGPADLQNPNLSRAHDPDQSSSQLYLLESRKAPRPLLSEFLKNNGEVEVLNLSETKDTFSSLIGQDHQRVQGCKILLDYDSSVNYLDLITRFFTEATSNAETCALFTSKSSKVYRTLNGNKMIKIIAASSIVSTLSEVSDGEVQIPDHELGLVASITSELLEKRTMNTSLVYDSIQDLIMGEHWEQIYTGIRQLFELVSVPNATVMFLCNRDTMDPKLLAAIRSFFSVQLRLDSTGLNPVKMSLN